MTAATAGDLSTVESMVATGAMVPASEWVSQNKGLLYTPHAHVFDFIHETPCGIEMVANLSVVHPEGWPVSRSLLMKRENGSWKVYQGPGAVCVTQ